ncbi:phospholipase A2-like [Episyrphus balteatus]|uniref:phospholipase A2-like n=1 Tax=Episyrphus balteatus TaxID=286459 RepID=UPI002484EC03|nr:phospholipase A2-like [Episyrphus balteatus]
MEVSFIKNISRYSWGLIIFITFNTLQWMAMSQLILDSPTTNEVFGEFIYDDSYSDDFTIPSSNGVDNNFSKFILSQSRNNVTDKTTRQGLDITSPEMFQSKTIAQLYAVFPGTVWCGIGNLASNSQVLGYFAQTDSCCRTHDKCMLTIPPGSTKFGLKNDGYFTRSHCSCDEKFYFCLKKANSFIANKIGYTYFNLLRPQCFRKEYQIVACLRWIQKRCKMYVLNPGDGMEWQWFDNREF